MSLLAYPELLKKLGNSKYRNAYVSAQIRRGIAYQNKVLREQRGWSQPELSRRADKPQSVISRLENPNYGKVTVQTLLDLAATFNVALLVRFVPFERFIRDTRDLSPEAWEVPDFESEVKAAQEEVVLEKERTALLAVRTQGQDVNAALTGHAHAAAQPLRSRRREEVPSHFGGMRVQRRSHWQLGNPGINR